MSRVNKVYAGVDIGSSKIIVTAGIYETDRDFRVLGSAIAPSEHVEFGEILNVDRVAEHVAFGVRQLSEKFGVRIEDVFFGFSGSIECRQSMYEVSVSNKNGISQIDLDLLKNQVLNIKREGKEILDVSVIRYKLDDREVKNPLGYKGYSLKADFLAVYGKSDQVEKIRQVARRAGLTLQGIILHQVAATRTIVSPEAKEVGVVVVDLGADVTKLAVYYNNALLHLSNIPIGGNVVTNDIKQVKNVSFGVASKIKVDFGAAHPGVFPQDQVIPLEDNAIGVGTKQITLGLLAQIIEARMGQLFDLTAGEVAKSNFYNSIGYGALLTGGGAFMRGVADLFSQRTGIESAVALPLKDAYLGDTSLMAWPYVAVSTGILLEGVERPFHTVKQGALWDEEELPETSHLSGTRSKRTLKSSSPKAAKKGPGLFDGFMSKVSTLFTEDLEEVKKDTFYENK